VISTWTISTGGQRVSVCDAATPLAALLQHVQVAGGDDKDIVRIGTSSVSWRGVVYRAQRAQLALWGGESGFAIRGD
jgi:hypothetical protein